MASLRRFQALAFILLFVLVSIALAQAHEESTAESAFFDLSNPLLYLLLASVLTLILLVVAVTTIRTASETRKKLLFWGIALPIMLATFYLAGHTIYQNVTSVTHGPVHWHADYEVRVCEQRLDLLNPKFPSNKIGSPLLHEHNDERIHIEGVINELHHVALGSYFRVIGGGLAHDELAYPSTKGRVGVKNGDSCPDGSTGTLKVYVNGKRIQNPADYVPYPSPYVPPGDCIIIVFDNSTSETTEHTCASWEAKDARYTTYKRQSQSIGDMTWQ